LSLKDYLQLGRSHTAPVEMFGLAIAAYLAGIGIYFLPLFTLLGWLVHVAGFGMNSLVDYLYGYDKSDPSKVHHPLVSGRISVLQATLFVFGMQLAGMYMFFLLTHSAVSVAAFAGYVVFGWMYNILAKRNKLAAMFELGLSMGLLFFSLATIYGRVNILVIMASAYIFFTTMYQIGVCGDLKDLAAASLTGERNILQDMGVSVLQDKMTVTNKAVVFSDLISILKSVALAAVAYLIQPAWMPIILVLALATFLYYSHTAMKEGAYNHAWRLKVIGMGEVWGYIIFVITLFPLMIYWAPYAFIYFFILPVVYYYIMNRIMWPGSGSGWAPGV
jgi:hypothetical protein